MEARVEMTPDQLMYLRSAPVLKLKMGQLLTGLLEDNEELEGALLRRF